MTRLARGRETHLTREEIAAEALRQFDAGNDPSIRGLASELGVAPSAIYHHFAARDAIVDAALALVWEEASEEGMRLLQETEGEPAPADLLVAAGLATRRTFGRHHQLAPHMAGTQQADERLAANLGLLAGAYEGMGLSGEDAARAFHAFGSFALGSTLVLAARLNLGDRGGGRRGGEGSPGDGDGGGVERTRRELEAIMDLSYADPERDEELFVDGLRRLIATFEPG